MRIVTVSRVLLAAALSTFLVAQDPVAADGKQLRQAANAAVQAGDFATAASTFRKLTEAEPKNAQAWHMLGYSLHALGKLDEALPVHEKAASFPETAGVGTYNVACVHALKGKADEAFAWLDKAVAAGFADLDQLQGDADFDGIRADPRMAKLEATLKAAAKGGGGAQAFAQTVARKSARVAWFSRSGSPGQFAVDWSPVPWHDEYEAALAAGKFKGKKWRLGSDFWTTLDTSLDLQLGGVAVPAGYYYLTLEQRDGDACVLALHDAAAVKKLKLDAFMADKLKGGIEVPVHRGKAAATAAQLTIAVEMKAGSRTEGTLAIRFGGHEATAPFTTKFD